MYKLYIETESTFLFINARIVKKKGFCLEPALKSFLKYTKKCLSILIVYVINNYPYVQNSRQPQTEHF